MAVEEASKLHTAPVAELLPVADRLVSGVSTRPDVHYRRQDDEGVRLKTISFSAAQAQYAETLASVIDDREEVVVTDGGHDPVVIVALDDCKSLLETAYLMKSPANAKRLLAAIERLESGQGTVRDPIG